MSYFVMLSAIVALFTMSGNAAAQDLITSAPTWVLDRAADDTPLFKGPVGIRCDSLERVWVVDDLAHRLLIFSTSGEFEELGGGFGPEDGRLMWPDAVDWDNEGNVYVADTGANRIQVWRSDGSFVRDFGRPPRWRRGMGPGLGVLSVVLALAAVIVVFISMRSGQASSASVWGLVATSVISLAAWALVTFESFNGLYNPRDVLVGPDGLIYVSDFQNDAVRVFNPDGTLVRSIGKRRLSRPLGLVIGDAGRLYVADSGHHVVQVFSLDGTFITSFGRPGSAAGELDTPHGLAIDSSGFLYVADRGNGRVQVWTQDGASVKAIAPESADGDSRPFRPAGLCISNQGELAVADLGSARVVMMGVP